jgi:hypothetical protein
MPSPHWSGCPDGVRVSCAFSPCGVRTRTNALGACMSLAMMAIRRTVRTVAVVDDVVRLALGMATGMIHGEDRRADTGARLVNSAVMLADAARDNARAERSEAYAERRRGLWQVSTRSSYSAI